ncbi:MAG: nucleoside 2-deoxyribosyltransferase [Candidatus Nanoarchaeia archaeon]|nr:nucleoside 2-deoxyribosyltransferase [Candidatus Nanoarchaeia archaeon]
MKAYIAGHLWKEEDRKKLDQLDSLCKRLGIETFVPHRDVGVYEKGDSKSFFKKDSEAIDDCQVIIALLDWKLVGSGTAWEIGYAYAKGIPVIALVEDLKSINTFDRMCVMTFNSARLVENLEELKKELITLQA